MIDKHKGNYDTPLQDTIIPCIHILTQKEGEHVGSCEKPSEFIPDPNAMSPKKFVCEVIPVIFFKDQSSND